MVLAYFYANALKNFVDRSQNIDLDTNTIKVMLTTNTYTPNQDTHSDKADVTNEVSGTGYTAGGATLGTKSVSLSNNVLTFDAADTTWSSSTITARRAVLYDDSGGTDADKALIGWVDFEADQSSSGGDFTIAWNASGIFTITATDASGFP